MLRRAAVVMSLLWASAIPLSAFAATRPHGGGLTYGFALAVYAAGSVVCHQLPWRSFHLWSAPLPVCARCTGIYLGAAFAALAALTRADRQDGRFARTPVAAVKTRYPPLAPGRTKGYALILACIPTALTLAYEWTTATPANWIRAAAGAPLGAAAAWIVIH